MNRLHRFFEISVRGSTITNEIRGGVVTFIAMAYIIVLNPIILSGIKDVSGSELEFDQVSAVTSLAAGVMTILFGVISRLPFAFAAGLGLGTSTSPSSPSPYLSCSPWRPCRSRTRSPTASASASSRGW